MGNASSHSNRNLPILLAGGGFKHVGHMAHPKEGSRGIPLCNLYLSMLQKFGMKIDNFNTATVLFRDWRLRLLKSLKSTRRTKLNLKRRKAFLTYQHY